MKADITKAATEAAEAPLFLGVDWFDPLEAGVRTPIRSFIEELLQAKLDVALGRDRYQRRRLAETGVGGWPVEGKRAEWKNATIPAYQRRTKRAGALIAGAYFAGTNTRRVRRALAALFGGAVGPFGEFRRYGQPSVAQGKGRLGRLEWPFARR